MVGFLLFEGEEHSRYLVWVSTIGGISFSCYVFIRAYRGHTVKHFKEYRNIMDVASLLNFWLFWVSTLFYNVDKSEATAWWRIYNRAFLIISIILRLNFFMRIYEKLGSLVHLLHTCLYDIIPFTSYLFIWLFGFYLLYTQAHIKTKITPFDLTFDEKDADLHEVFYIWENSIGSNWKDGLGL